MSFKGIILLVITALTFVACSVSISDKNRHYNIILVMTDDQGYGEFSCNGNPIVTTPNIDKLAVNAVRFTDFHVSPMCTPTRGQLMTGQDAFRNGAINVSSGRTLLRSELKTMANVFKDAGYQTGIFGKWHLGDNYPYSPEDRGFDEAIWFPSSHINSLPDYWDNDYFDDTYIHNKKREKYIGYCTDVFFNEAVKWMDIQANQSRPFFTYIPLNAAHSPLFVPDKYREVIKKAIKKKPEVVAHLSDNQIKNLTSFLAMGANIDENMGKLDNFLIEKGLVENTIVVFLTDNGSTMGEIYYNAGMKGRKTTLWEGGHRVPLFIKAPGSIVKKPATINELCQVQDLLPTLASMAGIKDIPGNLDGIDLSPLVTCEKETLGDRMLVINYSRMPSMRVNYTTDNPAIPKKEGACVLWKNWRLLENKELYNVSIDPHQNKDVANEYPDIVEKLQLYLDEWWNDVKDKVMEPQRIIIGSDEENPMMISACEWLDVFVDQQRQSRQGVKKNGVWYVTFNQPGKYLFELRRWPRETGLSFCDSIPVTIVVDGEFVKGVPLDIHSAKIKIGENEKSKEVEQSDTAVEFKFDIKSGKNTIQTWFNDKNGEPICGSYYVYIQRLE